MNHPQDPDTSNTGTAANDGSAGRKTSTQPPNAESDRNAPGPSRAPVTPPLPIAEIEEEEDDAKGG